MIKNILWDLDGTIFDTYPAITYAISKSLNEMGRSIALNVIDGLARQSIEQCLITLSQRFQLDPDLLRARFAESYRRLDPAHQHPYPGVIAVCELIHQGGGVNAIVTHRGIESTKTLLDTHALSACFDDIFSVEQGYARKPDPSMVQAAMEKYALQPTETMLIGDRELDILAGQAAGIRTCLIGQAELKVPADVRVDSYSQLLDDLIKESKTNFTE